MKRSLRAVAGATVLSVLGSAAFAQTITIATVNNGDMIRMQGYTDEFTAQTGINVDQGRPVRHHDDRHVRDTDLGCEWLAGPA